jgi:SAM-dependent methyltransferase
MPALDVGSGMGDVLMPAAEIVGPRGRVLGVDRDPVTTDEARRRARNEGEGPWPPIPWACSVLGVQASMASLNSARTAVGRIPSEPAKVG